MQAALKSLKSLLFETFLLLLSACLSSISFPTVLNYDGWGFLSFFSFIPALYLLAKTSYPRAFFYGFLYGFVFYLIYNYWLSTFHPLAILIVPIIECFQYMLFFPAAKLSLTLFRKRGYILFTLISVSYYYITQQGFFGYPYGNISASLWNYPRLIQIASITGIWGLLFLQIIGQAFVAERLARRDGIRQFKVDIIVYVALMAINLIYGSITYCYYDAKEPERALKVASIEHSADTWIGGSTTYRKNLDTLMRLTEEALKEEPEMVVWSETAFVPSVTWHTAYPISSFTSRMVDDFVSFGLSLGLPLVTGNPEGVLKDPSLPAYLSDGSWNVDYYNTVIFFNDGAVQDTYRKQHLVPFTEHFPYQETFPRLTALLRANDYKWWLKGDKETVFFFDEIGFSTPICFEDTFGYLSAAFVRNGADMLINLTNDVWSKSVVAEVQHMQLSVFRAIENRRPLLRSTNSGITCLVEPSGKVVEPLEPFIETYHVYEVPLFMKEGFTFYTRHTDLFAHLAIAYSAILIVYKIIANLLDKKAAKELEKSENPDDTAEFSEEQAPQR